MTNFRFGRTSFEKESLINKIKNFDIKSLRNLKWKDLSPVQRKKIIFGSIIAFIIMLLIGLFTQNDEEAYKSNINDFVKYSALYDSQSTIKTTTSAAQQLIIPQANKLKEAKGKGYKTKINKIDTKIVSQKGNAIIGTTRVDTTEQIGNDPANDFTHLFVFQGQKIGASWKISNILEAEAKKINK